MKIIIFLFASFINAAERVPTSHFEVKDLDVSKVVMKMSDLSDNFVLTNRISLETLTPLELMNLLTETNNILRGFGPMNVQWDRWSTTLRLIQLPTRDTKQIALGEFIVYPNMTTVVPPRIIKNMRPRNYRQLNEWADIFVQMHPMERIMRMFDQGSVEKP